MGRGAKGIFNLERGMVKYLLREGVRPKKFKIFSTAFRKY
jgi:hypothetical protein